jgi:hypothetical protein
MVTVPVRAPPVLAAIVMVTLPLPVPLLPDVTVTNDALLTAVHAAAQKVETVMVVVPPLASALTVVAVSEYKHPDCVIGKVCPPATMPPDRVVGSGLAVMLKPKCPVPIPYGVLAVVGEAYGLIHESDAAAIHEHVVGAFRSSSIVVPPPVKVAESQLLPVLQRSMLVTQLAEPDGPDCTTFGLAVTPNWPMVSVAPRTVPAFAATLMPIDPGPVPDAADVIVTKLALLCALHPHPLDVVIVTVATPPSEANSGGVDVV